MRIADEQDVHLKQLYGTVDGEDLRGETTKRPVHERFSFFRKLGMLASNELRNSVVLTEKKHLQKLYACSREHVVARTNSTIHIAWHDSAVPTLRLPAREAPNPLQSLYVLLAQYGRVSQADSLVRRDGRRGLNIPVEVQGLHRERGLPQ